MTNFTTTNNTRAFSLIMIGCLLAAAVLGWITDQYLFWLTMGAAVGVAVGSTRLAAAQRRRPTVSNQH